MIATELFDFSAGGGGALEFKRSRAAKKRLEAVAVPSDVESGKKQEPGGGGSSASSDTLNIASDEEALEDISGSESIFTWENLEYTVPYRGGSRKLLNKVDGIAKPGIMVALVGASGAGKTTLLNTLSQRQTMGVVSGYMFVDGRPLGTEFQRGTGFCEHMDLHDG
jgi:ATP-binding cassette subfamily G (WHITE) protein 2 (SNQ2)